MRSKLSPAKVIGIPGCSHVWLVLLALVSACGRINYDPITANDGSTSFDDASVSTDASTTDGASGFSVGVRLVGSDTCQSASSVIAIDATGVGTGNVLAVQFVIRGDAGTVSVTDSQSNSYVLLAAPGGSALRTHVFAATITSALTLGDTIVVAHPSGSSTSAMAVELSGVVAPALGIFEAGAADTTIVLPFAPPLTGLMYCAFGLRNATFEVTAPWTEGGVTTTDCGGAVGGSSNIAYWLAASGAPASSCDGAILSGADQWQGVVLTFGE